MQLVRCVVGVHRRLFASRTVVVNSFLILHVFAEVTVAKAAV